MEIPDEPAGINCKEANVDGPLTLVQCKMVKDHEKDVKEFESASQKAQDPDLKAFAAKTLPVLQEHLRLAESVQSTVNATQRQSKAD